jgi:hypothetical protein
MKHLFSFLLLGALCAVTFYNCQKQPLSPSVDATTVSAQNEEVGERGGPCNIVLSATGAVEICGTSNGAGTCTMCSGAAGAGKAFFGYDGNPTHTFGSSMLNGTGSIKNISGEQIRLFVFVNGVQTQMVILPAAGAGSCVNFSSGDCFFTI